LRGGELTQRLLAFSRQQPLQPKVTDLSVLVNGMKDMLRRTLGETIRIETVASADLRRSLADPGQVENALLNLAINARDAMPDGGKLTISVGNATPEDASAAERHGVDPGNFVLLSVGDTGTGMTSEVLERVFEPFFTTKDVGQGSGLGLSMIYGFAQQSGGYVTIESAPGHGTTVRIFLPQAEAGAVDREPDAITSEPRGRNETILVVEDDADVRNLTVSLLERLGYAVLEAEDGNQALAVLETAPGVDLLLTDAVLPGGMSGPQFIKEAKRRHGEIKALLMSGYSMRVIEQHGGLDAGVGLINKPFQRYDLAQKLRDVLDLDRA
jgi:CheY-like chemotaxis protein